MYFCSLFTFVVIFQIFHLQFEQHFTTRSISKLNIIERFVAPVTLQNRWRILNKAVECLPQKSVEYLPQKSVEYLPQKSVEYLPHKSVEYLPHKSISLLVSVWCMYPMYANNFTSKLTTNSKSNLKCSFGCYWYIIQYHYVCEA